MMQMTRDNLAVLKLSRLQFSLLNLHFIGIFSSTVCK